MAGLRFLGAHEIRLRLGGVSRQRVYQITNRAPAENLIRPGSPGVPEVRVRLELLPMAVAELVIATA